MRDIFKSELDGYAEWVAEKAARWPKKVKKTMNKSGTELKRKTLRQMRLVNLRTVTGRYKSGIKRGKYYQKDGSHYIRVYSNAPHAHLIEDGHDVVNAAGKVGHAKGRKVFAKAEEDYEEQFFKNCEELVDELIDELCK
ncbi:HK97 gp10 family phage protein [Agathobaculum sp.]|uniref:HK97 gp10 family phage protein n=1 Tax=Agathobaculum sp. TaxID=2048138 RepID=UPI003FD82DCE